MKRPDALRIEVAGEASFLTPPAYGVGSFLVHIRVTPSGSLDVIRVFAGDAGIQDVARGESSRTKLREEFEGLAKTLHTRPIAMPGLYVAARIQLLVDEHRAAGRTLDERSERILAALPQVSGELPHPTRAWAFPEGAAARVDDSLALHGEAEVSRWLPSGRAVASVSAFVAERRKGVDLTAATPDDDHETRDAFAEGIDAFYTPLERRRLALALRDVAVLFGASRRVDRAMTAVAVAAALEAEGEGARAAHEVPFVFGLFYKYILARRESDKTGA